MLGVRCEKQLVVGCNQYWVKSEVRYQKSDKNAHLVICSGTDGILQSNLHVGPDTRTFLPTSDL